jgi:hypothetical protein
MWQQHSRLLQQRLVGMGRLLGALAVAASEEMSKQHSCETVTMVVYVCRLVLC